MLITSSAQAQNLFVSDTDGNINEYTPGGVQSTFATGLETPLGLACNSAGDLFAADDGSDNIYEYTPGGVRSTFATGLHTPLGLACNSAGDLFAVDSSGNINEFTPDGVESTFATGLGNNTIALAFNGASDLFAADYTGGNIYEFTPGGVQSTFASGGNPGGLAFQPVPEPSALGLLALGVTALLVHRRPASFAFNAIGGE